MADKARKLTDKRLSKMEKHISNIYNDAKNDLNAKWNDYLNKVDKSLTETEKLLKTAYKNADDKAIKELQEEYKRILRNKTIENAQYKAMVDQISEKLTHVNEIATAYVNGNMPYIYSINYNQISNDIHGIKGISFSLVDEQTVRHLMTTNNSLLPQRKVNVAKDIRWNKKQINSQVLQGILQGESIPKIAKRLQNVTDMSKESAIRNARTMTTNAECKGRQASYEKVTEDGVIMKKVWIATHDERTRAWHDELDGVEIDIDEEFENEYGAILYPADATADPANVYNCRCSIKSHVIGFKKR